MKGAFSAGLSMAPYEKIKTRLTHSDSVLEITLASPPGNILDRKMMAEITKVLMVDGQNPNILAIVLAAEGDHFSYGASIEEHQKDIVTDMLEHFHHLCRTWIEVAKPTVVLVEGHCLGGGLELALFGQWIFAGPKAHFGQPEIKLGVFPPVGSLLLPYFIGQRAADDLVLTGRIIDGQEAAALGLIHDLSDDPQGAADRFLEDHLLDKSGTALPWTVRASRFSMYRRFLEELDGIERMYLDELMETDDANEGIAAFLEKRRPDWKHR